MKILFKLATRSRPNKFFLSLQNIYSMLDDRHNYHIITTCDEDDETMRYSQIENSLKEMQERGICVTICWGNSKNKIEAINSDMHNNDDWQVLVNMSDDMIFTQQGFDNIIRGDMNKYFPDLDGVLHYNDGNQKSNVMTMSIMGRKYYERFNYIYYPGYQSLWCDAEATEVAKMLGKYQYMGDEKILFRHMHPAFGLAEYDEQYRKTESKEMWDADEKLYNERKARNFDLILE